MIPFVPKALPAAAGDLDLGQRAGHRVEPGGENDRVHLDRLAGGANPVGRDLLDRMRADIDQPDVVAVIGLIIVGIDAQTLGADRMILRSQKFGRLRIVDDGPDLVAHELRRALVGLGIDDQIGERSQEIHTAALLPQRFEDGVDLVLLQIHRRPGR